MPTENSFRLEIITAARLMIFLISVTAVFSASAASQTGTVVEVQVGRSVSFANMTDTVSIEAPRGTSHPYMPAPPAPVGVPGESGSLSSLSIHASAVALPSPTPAESFPALDDNNRDIPPDTQGAVGPAHLLVTLNSQIRVMDRFGTGISTVSLKGFWTNLVDGVNATFDPKVLYDVKAGRWIIVTLANPGTTNSSLLLAISQNTDPTQNWTGYRLVADNQGRWFDFPLVGFNGKWIVVTGSLYANSDNRFSTSRIFVLPKAALYAGQFPKAKTFDDPGFAMAPTIDYDNTLTNMFLVNVHNPNFSGKGYLRFSSITNDVGSEVFTPGVVFPSVSNPWAASPASPDFGPQLGTDQRVNTGDNRLENGVTYKNGSIWFAHTVFLPADQPTHSVAQWWELTVSGTVRQFGRIEDTNQFFAFPSLGVNKSNDVLVGYTRFSATQYPSANYSFHAGTDAPGTMRTDTVLKAGETSYVKTYEGTENRWGDFSSTVADPLNDIDLWTLQQYAGTPTNSWGTWWGKIRLDAVSNPPVISGFTPATAGIGSSVVISGSKFANVSDIKFNGVSASAFSVDSSIRITATVPFDARDGPISVVTPGYTVVSTDNFSLVASPAISNFLPDRGDIGSTITISGRFLLGVTNVTFSGIPVANFTVFSDGSQVIAAVPAGATTGPIAIFTTNGIATTSSNFTLTLFPAVGTFSPAQGGVGSTITINGANFLGANKVEFNGIAATQFAVVSSSQITAVVPPGATAGPIRVTTLSGAATSTTSFVLVSPPTVASFSPTTAAAGETVVITGSNLTGATVVSFNGAPDPTFVVDSGTQISARVPAQSTTGPISVTTPGGTGASAASFNVILPPANDAFTNAQVLSGASGTLAGSNRGATKEPGEPEHADAGGGRSVWFRWTAPSQGTWNFNTFGSQFDTVLAIYTGTSVTNLVEVAANDNANTQTNASSASFIAEAGKTYQIAVAGFQDLAGAFTLNWSSTSAPLIFGFTPSAGAPGATVTITGTNFANAKQVTFQGVPAASFVIGSSSEITAIVPAGSATGPISISNDAGSGSGSTNFTVGAALANDFFKNAAVLTGTNGSIAFNNSVATAEPGEPDHAGLRPIRSVWFRWTAPITGKWTFDTAGSQIDTVMAVYTGTVLTNLTDVASNDDAPGGIATSLVTFTTQAGTEYFIAVDGFAGSAGNVDLNWSFAGNVPSITGFAATKGDIGSSITITGQNLIDVTAISFNGVSSTNFTVKSATNIIAVVPNDATSGPIVVESPEGIASSRDYFEVTNVGAPANDRFANAAVLAGSMAIVAGNTTAASVEVGEPNHLNASGRKSVWYRWTAPQNGAWIISTAGSLFDTVLAIYTGGSVTNLTLVADDDDADGQVTSSVKLQAVANTVYSIAIDGYSGDSGAYTLRLFPAADGQVLYSTGFEPSDGFQVNQPVPGQGGWKKAGIGASLIVTNLFPGLGQQAKLSPTNGAASSFFIYHPINFIPTTNSPKVEFSVLMDVVNSTVQKFDIFRWSIYNTAGKRLFSLEFDNGTSEVGYELDDGQGVYLAEQNFNPDTQYQLDLQMDFIANRWNATLNQITLVENEVITTLTNSLLTLGDVDGVWVLNPDPGNNYLLFDNYSVIAPTNIAPAILVQPTSTISPSGTNVTFSVIARGDEPMSYQWSFNGTPVAGATNAVLTLNNVLANNAGNYTVAIANVFGTTVTSTPAVLSLATVTPTFALSNATLGASGTFQFTLQTAPGSGYAIESSTNLNAWSTVTTGINANGSVIIQDTRSVSRRFYRARGN